LQREEVHFETFRAKLVGELGELQGVLPLAGEDGYSEPESCLNILVCST